ncbi:MAG: hypothetical protein OXU36_19785 [Candidatus Poribacteria bacterium]|nr:hypothetical protein [Candidatus Poribacteria bacterium]
MKSILYFSILLCAIAIPSFAELTDADLDKIRLIVKEEIEEEIKPLKADINTLKADINTLKIDVARLEGRITGLEGRMTGMEERFTGVEGRFNGIEKQISHATNVTYGLIALLVVAIGIPAWRGRSDREQDRKIEQLTREIETLKQQRAVNPSRDSS